jgi:hypothetical protein
LFGTEDIVRRNEPSGIRYVATEDLTNDIPLRGLRQRCWRTGERHITQQFFDGGSALLLGERRSISDKQVSKTLAACDVSGATGNVERGLARTDVHVPLRAGFDVLGLHPGRNLLGILTRDLSTLTTVRHVLCHP